MSLTQNRLEFIHEIVFAVVARHFPEENHELSALWSFWATHRSRSRTDGFYRGVGLAATAPNTDGPIRAVLILVMDLLVPEPFPREWTPVQSDIDEAAQRVARTLGLSQAQVSRAVLALAPELQSALARSQTGRSLQPPQADDIATVWVDVWRDCRAEATRAVPFAELDGLISSAEVDLIVDEPSRFFRTRTEPHRFSKFDSPTRVGIWLALRHAGRSFTYEDIAERAGISANKEGKPYLRKYPHGARKALYLMLQRDIVALGKSGSYDVATNWSWMWVRSHQDVRQSRLL